VATSLYTSNLGKSNVIQLNVGNVDRAIRILLGVVLVALAASGAIGHWGYIGVIVTLTGLVAFCPLYTMLGFRTTSR
jgi:hypothetical protein